MIYLRKFENHAAYEAAQSGLILPNVSLCIQENEVHYNPHVDPCQQHDYVEIGRIKWATKNVGACSVTDYGLYFQWGDTSGYTASEVGSGEGKKYFDWADYKYCSGAGTPSSAITKYNYTDGSVLVASDDAAQAAWGGNWRMPTKNEYVALGNTVNTAWTNDYKSTGVKGLVCTAKDGSGAELFFPAAGCCSNGKMANVDSGGYYYSSSLSPSDKKFSYHLFFYSSGANWDYNAYRFNGNSVRAVLDE